MKKVISIRKKYKRNILARFDINNFVLWDNIMYTNSIRCPLCGTFFKENCKGCPFHKYELKGEVFGEVGCMTFLTTHEPKWTNFLRIGTFGLDFSKKHKRKATQILKKITTFFETKVKWY